MSAVLELTPDELLDRGRELAIQTAGKAMEPHYAAYERTGDFSERGAADAARLNMERLIKERSPAQIAKMERERGLSNA